MKNNIVLLRKEKNITQEQLANDLDVSRQTIIAIESEKYCPSLVLAFKIAKYFNSKGGGHKGAAGFVSDKIPFSDQSVFVI